jgi:probable rRNA maturation factor
MILIDPELDFSAAADALNLDSAKPTAGPAAAQSQKLPAKPLLLPSTRTLAQFLTRAQAAVRLRGHVTVLLTSDVAMRDLNARFRGKKQPTDVLSFRSEHLLRGTENVAGDVAISVETAIRQSVEQGHSLATEIKVLMLHGLLHLAGHDHETDAGEMQRRERSLRARLGLPLGLIERTESVSASRRVNKPARKRKP